jgi:hypothetical protein
MKNSTPGFSNRLFPKILLAGAILVLLAVSILIIWADYIPRRLPSQNKADLERIRTELPLAEARWKSHNISNFEIDVEGFHQLARCADSSDGDPGPLHLKVRQGELVFESDARVQALKPCDDMGDFLPPKVFDTVRALLADADPRQVILQIEFDPEYGFVSSYYTASNYPLPTDSTIRYTFSNFQPKVP